MNILLKPDSSAGVTHRFVVLIDEESFTFEPDEEGSYRSLGNAEATDVHLLRAIVEKLVTLPNQK
ncbi:hypothetical protein ACFQZS_03170 [Mucilaginibacter calamicampi]|uniref:Uncharacterized protein n=1 Tax=Mucilaginibacter calamicampi TaxID=1302352 RepID=A0ABW2YRW0_9SPHI